MWQQWSRPGKGRILEKGVRPRLNKKSMKQHSLACLISVAALAAYPACSASPAAAAAKNRSDAVNPHCVVDASAPQTRHQLNCSLRGDGRFEIKAEADLSEGGADATAQLSIVVDGHPCGRSVPVNFTGRETVYDNCAIEEFGPDRHDFTVAVDYRSAKYGSMDVNLSRRLPKNPGPGR